MPIEWLKTGELHKASSVSSLFVTERKIIYASAVASIDENRNEGLVFRSTDEGATWERIGRLDGCWSLSRVLQLSDGSLLAGGMMLSDNQAEGVIYKSNNEGNSWNPVLTFPNGAVYDLKETSNGHLYATTGWNGTLFKSEDKGNQWSRIMEFGRNINIHSIAQTSRGDLFLTVEAPDGGQIMKSKRERTWTPVKGLHDTSAVYNLIEGTNRLYAGASAKDGGWVYQSDLNGTYWAKTWELPDTHVKAVRSLLKGPRGEIFAGTETTLGSSYSKVFVSETQGGNWRQFRGPLDLATTIYTLAKTSDTIYAGSGHIYGNVYKCALDTVKAR
jgi:photosystem II stability/assembly factor-like uncharacterized protein